MFRNRSGYAVAIAALFAATGAQAAYDQPSKPILAALHAPLPPTPSVSPTHADILLVSRLAYPPIARVAEPYLRDGRLQAVFGADTAWRPEPMEVYFCVSDRRDFTAKIRALFEHLQAGMAPAWRV